MLGDAKDIVDSHALALVVERHVVADVEPCAPVLEAEGFVSNRVENGVASVAHLRRTRGPGAVILEVAPLVVDALKRKAWLRNRAHVSEEVLEGLKPRRADDDSSSSVILEVLVARICAACLHVCPAEVLGASRHAVSSLEVVMKAAAGRYTALFEVIAANCSRIAAVARAIPVCAFLIRIFADDHKAPVTMPGSVNFGGHNLSSCGGVC